MTQAATRIICPDGVFSGGDILRDVAVEIAGSAVQRLLPVADIPRDAKRQTVSGVLSRGFFDIQVNGGGGVLVNTDPSPEGLRAIAHAHRLSGTTAILPTVISDRPEVLDQVVDAILETAGQDGIAGLHIEGPHIAKAKRGTHSAEVLRPLDARTMQAVSRLRQRAIPVLITVAPEAATPEQIAALCETGAVVSLGHSDATAQATRDAFAAGATAVTHLYNAMSQMTGREAGVTGAAINSTAYCSVICDSIHVAPEMIALAYRARPRADRMIAVSDAMPTVEGPDSFTLYGRTIRLSNGRLVNDDGALAGAHLTLREALAFLVRHTGVDLTGALRSVLSNPARLMGLEAALDLPDCATSDLVVIGDDLGVQAFGDQPE